MRGRRQADWDLVEKVRAAESLLPLQMDAERGGKGMRT